MALPTPVWQYKQQKKESDYSLKFNNYNLTNNLS